METGGGAQRWGTESRAALAVFDAAELVERTGGDEELAVELAREFLSRAPGQRAELAALARAEDFAGSVRAAHRIRGALLALSAARAALAAEELEMAARDVDVASLVDAHERLEAALADTVAALETFADQREAGGGSFAVTAELRGEATWAR